MMKQVQALQDQSEYLIQAVQRWQGQFNDVANQFEDQQKINSKFIQQVRRNERSYLFQFFIHWHMSKKLIYHSHDSLFKKFFKDKEVAKDFFKNRLPAHILADIDLRTLQVEDGNHISDNLRVSYSDLVLSANIKGEKGYLYTVVR